MKAIYDGRLYVVVEMVNDVVKLEPVDNGSSNGEDRIEVNLADLRLTLDPTDDEVAEAREIFHMVLQLSL